MVDITKKHTTYSNGHEVRLFCDDGGGNYPIIGAINFDGFWQTVRWNQEGKSDCGTPSWSLVEVVKRERLVQILNVYEFTDSNGGKYMICSTHNDQEDADKVNFSINASGIARIASCQVVLDFVRGK